MHCKKQNLNPKIITPNVIQDKGLSFKRLIYWYGTPRDDLSQAYSFVNVSSITSYKEGCQMGYTKLPQKTDNKSSEGDLFIIRAIQELNAQSGMSEKQRVNNILGYGQLVHQVGQIKYITTNDSRYGAWENITTTNKDNYMTSINILNQQDIKLKHGGRLQFFKHFISKLRCEIVLKDVLKSNLLRQYTNGSLKYEDPRVHVLLSSDEQSYGGYQYHGTKMKPFPLSSIPEVEKLNNDIASYMKIEWNIGVHVIMYRNGSDIMGWHADDMQGETLVLTVVLESPTVIMNSDVNTCCRPVLIKTKWNDKSAGDEFIRLFPYQGDAYMMDGK